MEKKNNVLIWSCNRSKLRKLFAEDTYKEFLGYQLNTSWELNVNISPYYSDSYKHFNNEIDSCLKWGFYFINFDLGRHLSDDEIVLTGKIISNNIMKQTTFSLPHNTKSVSTFSFCTEDLVDYRLDLVFIFSKKDCSNLVAENKIQIEKMQSFSASLQTMLEKEHMADVTIICGSFKFKAHKSILSIKSPVFEAMFTNPMIEKESNVVVIKDMDSDILRSLITFIYSGKVEVESEAMIYDLLHAADQYQIKALKEGCVDYLKSRLSIENAIRILGLAELFDKELKHYLLNYVKDNFEELKSTK